MVVNVELKQLKDACREMYETEGRIPPRFTIIICGKRHKTRFYPTSFHGSTKNGNPMPGTVVDRGITEARNWDFYLQAHDAIKGTARPCHYFVVHDEIFRDIYKDHMPSKSKNVSDIVEQYVSPHCGVLRLILPHINDCFTLTDSISTTLGSRAVCVSHSAVRQNRSAYDHPRIMQTSLANVDAAICHTCSTQTQGINRLLLFASFLYMSYSRIVCSTFSILGHHQDLIQSFAQYRWCKILLRVC